MFILLACLIFGLVFYNVIAYLELYALIGGLYILSAVIFVVYFYLSYAMASKLPGKEDLNPDWDDARKEAYLKKLQRNQNVSKKLIYVLMPLFLILSIDMVMRYALGITPHELWVRFLG